MAQPYDKNKAKSLFEKIITKKDKLSRLEVKQLETYNPDHLTFRQTSYLCGVSSRLFKEVEPNPFDMDEKTTEREVKNRSLFEDEDASVLSDKE